ncbi:hypothetical protein [Paenibacillus monticola]|nr:hypothetical protein [Paenibacillus monticola]
MSLSDYEDVGGFNAFASAIQELLADGYLVTIIKSKKYKASFLDAVYWLPATAPISYGWSEANKLRVHDQGIDLHYYANHPEKQTTDTWNKIERVYAFLRTVKDREFITKEERSLELFDQEKWLSNSEGQQFLHNLGLTLDSLKAVNSREPFVYFAPYQTTPIRTILIAENKSFFHSGKRLMQSASSICGISPDMLIYGEGWKITSSLLFLEELNIDPYQTVLLYVGDLDKAGWDIYGNLKLKYSHLNLQLALPIYEHMMKQSQQVYDFIPEQTCNPKHLEIVLQEVSAVKDLKVFIERLLSDNKRIPQEVLNYEVMVRLAHA